VTAARAAGLAPERPVEEAIVVGRMPRLTAETASRRAPDDRSCAHPLCSVPGPRRFQNPGPRRSRSCRGVGRRSSAADPATQGSVRHQGQAVMLDEVGEVLAVERG
jgi:hypothetical protein